MSRAPQYARPRSLDDAMGLLDNLGAGTCVIAGGQELMPAMNYGVFAPSVLVDLNGVRELAGIREEDGGTLRIGALSVHRDIERHELVRTRAPLLACALSLIGGGWQVRNCGTLGGNIVSAHPLYDALPALLALRAQAQVRTSTGLRMDDLAALVRDPRHGLGTTAILTSVHLPQAQPMGWAYEKLKSTHGAYASANCAALVKLDEGGRLADVRLVVGAVTALPVDMGEALEPLLGQAPSEQALRQVEARCAAAVSQPLADQRGDADYRCAMAGVVARRALEAAAARARSLVSTWK